MATFFIMVALVMIVRILMVPGVQAAGGVIIAILAVLGAIVMAFQFITTPFGLLVVFLAICGACIYLIHKDPERMIAGIKHVWEGFRALSTKAKLGALATILGIIAVVIVTMG